MVKKGLIKDSIKMNFKTRVHAFDYNICTKYGHINFFK